MPGDMGTTTLDRRHNQPEELLLLHQVSYN